MDVPYASDSGRFKRAQSAPQWEGAYPVLFWMHGGAFMTGGGAIPWYSGEAFAREMGIVVVNVSYRLGVLGNLYLPGVADTNLSVHDVNQALNWAMTTFGILAVIRITSRSQGAVCGGVVCGRYDGKSGA